MIASKLCALLGVQYPVIQGGMAWIADAPLAAAGAEPTDLDYTESAMLAAYHSKASGGVNVQVDYTPVRYVKKPAGAKPGFVVYDRYFSAVVRAELPDGVREQKK